MIKKILSRFKHFGYLLVGSEKQKYSIRYYILKKLSEKFSIPIFSYNSFWINQKDKPFDSLLELDKEFQLNEIIKGLIDSKSRSVDMFVHINNYELLDYFQKVESFYKERVNCSYQCTLLEKEGKETEKEYIKIEDLSLNSYESSNPIIKEDEMKNLSKYDFIYIEEDIYHVTFDLLKNLENIITEETLVVLDSKTDKNLQTSRKAIYEFFDIKKFHFIELTSNQLLVFKNICFN